VGPVLDMAGLLWIKRRRLAVSFCLAPGVHADANRPSIEKSINRSISRPFSRSQTVSGTATAACVPSRCAAALLDAVLTACSAPGPATSAKPDAAVASAAAAAFARGAYAEAATAWQREALDAAPAKAASLRVRAADAGLLAGRARDAEDVLRWVSRDELPPADRSRLDLVLADLALRSNRPDEAEALLEKAAAALPEASGQRYRDLVARTQEQLTSPGSRILAQAAGVVANMDRYDPAASVQLLQDLESVTSHELSLRVADPQGDTRAERQLTGWYDLALVIRRNLVRPEGVSDAIAEWKTRHPEHLLGESHALDAWLRYRELFAAPRRTAVLLPASGSFRPAGDALRDGLVSAAFRSRAAAVTVLPDRR
jgi:outer membrane PBP1 activator LpoA protein